MAADNCNPCVRRSIGSRCKPKTGIVRILYACKDDVLSWTEGPDAGNNSPDALVNDIVVNNGVDTSYAFHEIFAVNKGDNKPIFRISDAINEDGTETNTKELTVRVYDCIAVRCHIDKLYGNENHFIIECDGKEENFEFIPNLTLEVKETSTETKAWDLTFRITDGKTACKPLWDTDYTTTVALVDSITAPAA